MHSKGRGTGCQATRIRRLWLLALSYLALTAAPCACVAVSTPAEFAQAFAGDQDVVLNNDITVNADNWAAFSADQPCILDRNLTVSSAPGAFYRLDYLFLQSKCRITPGHTVTFENLELANTRYGSGQNIDFFTASPNATVLLRNVVRRRPACAPSRVSSADLMALPRPQRIPGTQQVTAVNQVCSHGQCYQQNAVLFNDYALDSTQSADQLSYGGGYVVWNINTTMACVMLVPNSCIVARGPDRCVIDVISSILMPEQPADGSSKALAIVLPIVAAVIVMALIAGVLLWRRKKRRRGDEEQAKAFEQSSGALSGNVFALLNSTTPRAAEGWRMMAHRTALDFAAEPQDRIALGVLIGVGGHGRVYKGTWQGREVAVKVLQHNAATAHRVARECDLIMGFSHDYIVRAYHFVTWCQGEPPRSHPSSSNYSSRPLGSTGPLLTYNSSQPSQQQLRVPTVPSPHQSGSNAIQHSSGSNAQASGGNAMQPPMGSNGHQRQPSAGTTVQHILSGGAYPASGSNALQQASGSNMPVSGSQAYGTAQSGFANAAGVGSSGRMTGSSGGRGSNSSWRGGRGSGGAIELGGMQSSYGAPVTATSVSDEELDAQTWIVTEYCDAGSLYDMNRMGRLSLPDGSPALQAILWRLREVADAMTYLHASKVLHGDLKSANVLCTTAADRPYGVVAKVSDFGLSSMLVEGQTHKSTRTMGTVTHMAPETLRSGKLMPASDVYSFGILMWELISSKSAFSGKHYGEIIERVLVHNERPPIPPDAPEDYVLLMSSCWDAKPKLRPTFEAVRQCLDIMLQQRQEEQQQEMGVVAAQVAATVAANPQPSTGSTLAGSNLAASGPLHVSGFTSGGPPGFNAAGALRSPMHGRPPRPPVDEQEQRQQSVETSQISQVSGFF